MTQTDPELRCGPISTIQMDGNPLSLQLVISPFPLVWLARTGEVHLMAGVACRPIIKCGTSVVHWILSARCGGTWVPRWEAASHVLDLWGEPTRHQAHPCPIHCPPVEFGERETAVKLPLQPCLDIPAGFLRATRRVNSRLLECRECSRSTREIPLTLRAPVRPASRISPSESTGFTWYQASFRRSKSSIRVAQKLSLCPRLDGCRSPLHYE